MTEIDSVVIKFISAYIKSRNGLYSLKKMKKEEIRKLIEDNSVCYKPFCEQNRKQKNRDLIILAPPDIEETNISKEKKNFFLGKKVKANFSTSFWGKVIPILFKNNLSVIF